MESSNPKPQTLTDIIANMVDALLCENDLTLKLNEIKTFKHVEEVPPEEVIRYLKPTLLGRILVCHKHVLSQLPYTLLLVDNIDGGDLKLMVRRA